MSTDGGDHIGNGTFNSHANSHAPVPDVTGRQFAGTQSEVHSSGWASRVWTCRPISATTIMARIWMTVLATMAVIATIATASGDGVAAKLEHRPPLKLTLTPAEQAALRTDFTVSQ